MNRHGFHVEFNTDDNVYVRNVITGGALRYWDPSTSSWTASATVITPFVLTDSWEVTLMSDRWGNAILGLSKNGTFLTQATIAFSQIYSPSGDLRLVIGDPSSGNWSTGARMYVESVSFIPEPGFGLMAGLSLLGLLARRRRAS